MLFVSQNCLNLDIEVMNCPSIMHIPSGLRRWRVGPFFHLGLMKAPLSQVAGVGKAG